MPGKRSCVKTNLVGYLFLYVLACSYGICIFVPLDGEREREIPIYGITYVVQKRKDRAKRKENKAPAPRAKYPEEGRREKFFLSLFLSFSGSEENIRVEAQVCQLGYIRRPARHG